MAGKRGNGEGSIYQRSDGYYCAAVTLEGGKRKVIYAKTRQEVGRRLNDALQKRARGLPFTPERLTLAAYLHRWLEECARPKLKPKTLCSYEQLVRVHISPVLGSYPLGKLRAEHVQKFLNDKQAAGLSPRTVQYLLAVLRSALNRAVKWQLVDRNIATLVDPPRVSPMEVHPLSVEGAGELLAAASEHRFEHLFACLLATGLRLGEILALRWDDVNLGDGAIIVRHALERLPGRPWRLVEPKSTSGKRMVPLIGPAGATLRAQRARVAEMRLRAGSAWQDCELVFPSAVGAPLDGTNVYHEFKKLLRRIVQARYRREGAQHGDTVEGFIRWVEAQPDQRRFLNHRVHDLRHSTATYLLAAGVDRRIVMDMLGWSQLSMTVRYQHVLPEMLVDAAMRLEAVFPSATHAV